MSNKYDEYKQNIKSGDLLCWSHRGWGSWYDFKIQMVRLFTRSEYSHVGVAWQVGGRWFVIEAVEPRVRIYPLSKLGSFYHIPMKLNWTEDVEEKALSYVGAEYFQLKAIKAFFKPWRKGDVSECAALALQIYADAGKDMGDRATPDAITLQAQLYGHPTHYIKN